MTVLQRVCAIKIRPNLAARIVPGFPWNRKAWEAWRDCVIERNNNYVYMVAG